jgi:hypothetical protein
MVNMRSGPNWASIGFAQDALVGVRHSSILLRAAQARMGGRLVRRQVVQDDVDRRAVRPCPADRFQRGQGVICAFAVPVDAPELVVAEAVAAVEVAGLVF